MPKTRIIYTAQEVAKVLSDNGFPVIGVSEWTPETDGGVEITNKIFIQVGEGYLCVTILGEDDIFYYPERVHPDELVPDLREATEEKHNEMG